jgi:predicted ArsR family transcriptional regulator
MLERLIAILNRNSPATLDQLACELDTTPEMIAQLIEYLERNDLVKQLGDNCNTQCTGCYLAQECSQLKAGRLWVTAA